MLFSITLIKDVRYDRASRLSLRVTNAVNRLCLLAVCRALLISVFYLFVNIFSAKRHYYILFNICNIEMINFSNIIISALIRTSQHDRQNFLCFLIRWYTVLILFTVNYLTHAFTLWRKSDEKTFEYVFVVILTLLFLIAGADRGLNVIY